MPLYLSLSDYDYAIQLTTETVNTAVASLAQAVELTQGNEVEQNSAVLQTVADYLTDVANFVNNTNVTINATVSYKLFGGMEFLKEGDAH